LRLRFVAADGSLHERELVADTGSPCAVILGEADLALVSRAAAAAINTNFGPLIGGWLELVMPELGLTNQIHGFGSDQVLHAIQADSSNFAGLVGLPFLRLVEYGGDSATFWVRAPGGVP
jgi:hypothetical protein